MKTTDLIEKRRSQYHLILNWLRTDTFACSNHTSASTELSSSEKPTVPSPTNAQSFCFKTESSKSQAISEKAFLSLNDSDKAKKETLDCYSSESGCFDIFNNKLDLINEVHLHFEVLKIQIWGENDRINFKVAFFYALIIKSGALLSFNTIN
jgi:hypothetical protein